jgi:hypothetical protein
VSPTPYVTDPEHRCRTTGMSRVSRKNQVTLPVRVLKDAGLAAGALSLATAQLADATLLTLDKKLHRLATRTETNA